MAPDRTSPVPPVARAGFSNGATADLAVRRRDDRPGTLEHHDLAPLRGCRGGRPARAASSSTRSPSASGACPLPARRRRELADVRRQDGRPADAVPPVVGRGEPAQRLGVEDDRRRRRVLGRDEEVLDEGPASRARAAARDPRRSRRARGRGSGSGRRPARAPPRRPRAGPSSWPRRPSPRTAAGAIRGPRGSRGRRPSRAAARADEQRGAGVVERAGDDEQLAERALVAAARAVGQERRDRVVVELARAGRAGGRVRVAGAPAVAVDAAARRTGRTRPDGSGTGLGLGRASVRSRSIRSRIRRSRSSSRASMSGGNT